MNYEIREEETGEAVARARTARDAEQVAGEFRAEGRPVYIVELEEQ